LLWGKAEILAAIPVGESTLDRAIKAGRFPKPTVRMGRRLLWQPSAVEAWAKGSAPSDRKNRG
jgi:predicted DNA-binding transcriptional regulator AlpA